MANCKYCNKQIQNRSPGSHYYHNPECYEKYKADTASELEKLRSEDALIKCVVCGKEFKMLSPHLKREHNLTKREYKHKYKAGVVAPKLSNDFKEFWKGKNAGENNGMYGKEPWNKDETRKDEIKEKLGGHKKGKKLDQIIYRTDPNKTREKLAEAKIGITGEDANAYGPHNVSEEGRLNMKLGCAKALGNFIKNRTSKYEIEVMTYIKDMYPSVRTSEKIGFYHADGFIPELNLVIECDGSYWHAGIHKLIEEDKLNAQQKHVYRYDKQKTSYLINHKYLLIRILETDFQRHKKIGDTRAWLSTLLK